MNRNGVLKHVELHVKKLGSLSAVARVCDVNIGALSTIVKGKYGADESAMLQKIANGLNYRENNWNVVNTIGNYKAIHRVVADSKNNSMWFIIANRAGSGKSATFEDIYNNDESGSVMYIECEEWTGKQFMKKLISRHLGEEFIKPGYSSSDMLDIMDSFLNDKSLDYPVLMIDQTDKLKPSAISVLVALFNRTEDKLGVVFSGTENLEKQFKNGVRLAKKGYDEIESRCARTYIHLKGASKDDVYAICAANGIDVNETKEAIWNSLEKVQRLTDVRTASGVKPLMVPFVDDFRRLKRLIKRERLLLKKAA